MSNLVSFNKDGLEILVDNTTGESFCSVSGYARMSGKAQSTISERLTHRKDEVKEAEILTTTGLKTHRLVSEDLIVEWLPKDNPEMATKLLKLGVRKFLHELAGYNPEPKLPATYLEALKALVAVEEEREVLALKAAEQAAVLAEQAPKVEAYTVFLDNLGHLPMNEVAKVLDIPNMGRNKLFDWLRKQKILMSNNLPYQRYVDANYFVVIETLVPGQNFTAPRVRVTKKGMEYIRKLLASHGYTSKKLAA